MAQNNHKLFYITIGTFALTAIGVYFVYRLMKQSKKSARRITRKIDLSVFDSPDMPGSGNCMDRRLLMMLEQLEMRTGYPIFDWINSGARSEAHNRKVGGASRSSHKIPTCMAVDIGVPSTDIRNQLVYEARNIGFKRIGVGRTFVHLDTDENKSQYVAWGYPSGRRPDINPFV
ncbi:Peptidase M15A [Kordia algicida OT-1]|uniref:Peptidase M15A n=1 Tax=Kordia algicida OT-1 TaxID=391587 RepID=A9E9L7_9FLAO|nr:Peptidase M15A [Kordia algicida OT-1]